MRTRPSRGPLGLRGRILGAVLFTTVATLGVAAIALLGPLEQSLRSAELTTLRSEVGSTKATGTKSLERTVGPFRASKPQFVAQADIGPIKPPSGGAPVNPGERSDESSCKQLSDVDAQEACLQRQGQAAKTAIINEERSLQAATAATEVERHIRRLVKGPRSTAQCCGREQIHLIAPAGAPYMRPRPRRQTPCGDPSVL